MLFEPTIGANSESSSSGKNSNGNSTIGWLASLNNLPSIDVMGTYARKCVLSWPQCKINQHPKPSLLYTFLSTSQKTKTRDAATNADAQKAHLLGLLAWPPRIKWPMTEAPSVKLRITAQRVPIPWNMTSMSSLLLMTVLSRAIETG